MHATTVHRGQGSQFARVTVVLPPAESPLLTRELLYTAVTRARTFVRVVGSEAAVRAAVGRPVSRAAGCVTAWPAEDQLARARAEDGANVAFGAPNASNAVLDGPTCPAAAFRRSLGPARRRVHRAACRRIDWAARRRIDWAARRRTQRPVQHTRIPEPAAQRPLQAGDRVQVLRGAGVLVPGRGVAGQRHLRAPGERRRRRDGELGAALQSHDSRPRRSGRAGQAQVPGVAAPPAGRRQAEDRGSLARAQHRDHRVLVRVQVGRVVGLDVADGAGQPVAAAQGAVDHEQVVVAPQPLPRLPGGGDLDLVEQALHPLAQRLRRRLVRLRRDHVHRVPSGAGHDVDGVRPW